MEKAHELYKIPELYDLYFSYRNLEAEASVILKTAEELGIRSGTALDLGCGSSPHGRHMARSGFTVLGLDLSEEMLAYARKVCSALPMDFLLEDISSFSLPGSADLAICMNSTITYLVDDTALLGHLRSVSQALRAGGLYLFELLNPLLVVGKEGEDFFPRHPVWDEAGLSVRVGRSDFDLMKGRVKVEVEIRRQSLRVLHSSICRVMFPSEIALLARMHGMRHIRTIGDFDLSAASVEKAATFLYVLQKEGRG
ncbi:MAG: class I SAM-dependent methyltransferase [Armatimonadetes bacterium]|nr:class I SAM-dependent methyltransferase [Armatimonadota bacterium]